MTIPVGNMEAYYACEDNAATTVVVDSTATSNGTSSTNTSNLTTTGKVNDGFNLVAASSESIDCGFIPTTSTAFTWAAWVKTSTSSTQWIIGSDGDPADTTKGVGMLMQADGTVRVISGTAGDERLLGDSTTTVDDGSWHFVAVTFNGTNGSIFVDGGVPEVDTAWTPYVSDNNIFIGKRGERASLYWNGDLDEFYIASEALSDAEILELYNSGNGVTWPFETIISPSAFALSTSEQSPSLFVDIAQGLPLSAVLSIPVIDFPKANTNKGARGTKEIRTSHPDEEIGKVLSLVPEKVNIIKKDRVGLDA